MVSGLSSEGQGGRGFRKLTKGMASKSLHHTCAAASWISLSVPSVEARPTCALPMRFVAAEAGFFPPGPFTFFADIVATLGIR